jgi:hypothetical protein
MSDVMKKSIVVEIISFFLVFLFLYASLSKVLDYQKFRVQLGQSPLLAYFASWVSYFIPAVEIIVVGALVIPRYQIIGLYTSFFLMVLFTAYIIVITNFSEYIPCSCGGILQNMTWHEHLIFNLLTIGLIVVAILLHANRQQERILSKP